MKKGIFLLLLFINSSLFHATLIKKTFEVVFGRNKVKDLFFEQMKYGSDISNAYSERVALCPICAALNIIIVFPLFYYGSSKISKKVTTSLTKKLLKHSYYHSLLQIPLTFISNEFFFNTFIFGYSFLSKLIAAHCEYKKYDDAFYEKGKIKKLCTAMFYPNTSHGLFIQKELIKRFFCLRSLGNNLFLHRSGVRLRAGTYQNHFSINRLQVGRQILQLYKIMFMIMFSKNRKAWVAKKIQKLKKIEDIPFYLMLLGINVITTPQHIEQALQRTTPYDAPPQRKKTNIELLFRPLASKIPYAFAYVLYKILTNRSFTLSKESIKTSLTVKKSPYLIEIINAIKSLKKIMVYLMVFFGYIPNKDNDNNDETEKISLVFQSHKLPLDKRFLFDFLHRIVEKNTKEYFSPQQYYGMFLPCFKSFFVCILCVEGFDKGIITKKDDWYYYHNTPITPENFTTLLNSEEIKKLADCCINDTDFFKHLLTIEETYVLVPKETFNIQTTILDILEDKKDHNNNIKSPDFIIKISAYTNKQHFIFNLIKIQDKKDKYYYQDFTERTVYYNGIKKIKCGELAYALTITEKNIAIPYKEYLNKFSLETMKKSIKNQFNLYPKFELTDEDDAEYYGNPYYRYEISHIQSPPSNE